MKKTLLAVAIGALAVASTASANFYVQGDLGYSKVKVNDDGESFSKSRFTPTLAAGYNFGNFRLAVDYKNYGKLKSTEAAEAQETEKYTGTETETLKFYSLGFSAIYDIHINSDFTPYVGARIAHNALKSTNDFSGKNADSSKTFTHSTKVSEHKLGYGILAGASYKVLNNLFVDGGIEYNYLGSIDEAKVHQYGAKVGLRYEF